MMTPGVCVVDDSVRWGMASRGAEMPKTDFIEDAKAELQRRNNLLLPKSQIAASLGLLAMTAKSLSLIRGPHSGGYGSQ
ncbi:hypothetical protein SAMN03097708_01440 [Thiohalomonas denitrificans]|uniref:Uncharacterized protein n=1 Tax=Thiohalomonas denitrificans TaxID=415747 RepID=A0A1G5Q7A0_9GAMM|nr:hypothetical protein SAMN03097708_01440 [Thiohalomonas denitrificans]